MEGKRDYTNQEKEEVNLEKCMPDTEPDTEEATMKGEDLTQERDIAKENHAERMREQEAKVNQMDADLKTIKAALDVANRKGAYTLEEAYVIASASKRLF
jgi:LPS O-antigen subunit length determinant protein (WzzB/FepE family)